MYPFDIVWLFNMHNAHPNFCLNNSLLHFDVKYYSTV